MNVLSFCGDVVFVRIYVSRGFGVFYACISSFRYVLMCRLFGIIKDEIVIKHIIERMSGCSTWLLMILSTFTGESIGRDWPKVTSGLIAHGSTSARTISLHPLTAKTRSIMDRGLAEM